MVKLFSTLLILLFPAHLFAQTMANLVVDMKRTVINKGKAEVVKGAIFYQPPDEILLHITEPVNQWMKFKDKSLLIYYPEEKQGFRIQADVPFSLPFFQAFLGVMNEGLGLTEMGFTLDRNEIRADTLTTYWLPPKKAKRVLGPILIGLVNDRLVFMEMRNNKGKSIGRVSYVDYKKVGEIWLPLTVSAVRFQGKDTTYETVIYSNPRLNMNLPKEVTDFNMPEGVEVKEVRW